MLTEFSRYTAVSIMPHTQDCAHKDQFQDSNNHEKRRCAHLQYANGRIVR